MNAIDVVLVAVIVALVCVGVKRMAGIASGKRDCCSGEQRSAAKRFKTARIDDKDETHYPYTADLKIYGMSCDNCVKNVTNALESVNGTWATVDLASGVAHIRSKRPIDEDAYRGAVREAGYRAA